MVIDQHYLGKQGVRQPCADDPPGIAYTVQQSLLLLVEMNRVGRAERRVLHCCPCTNFFSTRQAGLYLPYGAEGDAQYLCRETCKPAH